MKLVQDTFARIGDPFTSDFVHMRPPDSLRTIAEQAPDLPAEFKD